MNYNNSKDPSLDLTALQENLNQVEHTVPPGAEESKFEEIDKTGLEPSQDNTTPEGQIQDKGTTFADLRVWTNNISAIQDMNPITPIDPSIPEKITTTEENPIITIDNNNNTAADNNSSTAEASNSLTVPPGDTGTTSEDTTSSQPLGPPPGFPVITSNSN